MQKKMIIEWINFTNFKPVVMTIAKINFTDFKYLYGEFLYSPDYTNGL